MPTRRRTSAPPKDARHSLITAALDLAVEQGWRRTTMAEIAATAKIPLDETYRIFRSKFALLAGFRRGIDEAVLAGPAPSINDPARDRLFEVLMRRFEALKPHRAALKIILRDSIGDPGALKALPGLLRSMSWMLATAGIPNAGHRGRLATRLVTGLYLSILPVFLRDEGNDLGTTMAALDRRLRQAEMVVNALAPIAARARKSRS